MHSLGLGHRAHTIPSRTRTTACSTRLGLPLLLMVLVVLVAACAQDDGDGQSQAETEPEGQEEQADNGQDDSAFPRVEDGVLQPLADGFPSEPITLWNAQEPGSPEDVFNQQVSRIAEEFSPVSIGTDTQQVGPTLHYGLAEFLQDQPMASEGYHVYVTSWFGIGTVAFTNEELADVPFDELWNRLKPINQMTFGPFVFFTQQDSQFETIEDVERFTNENPGELRVIGGPPGSGTHSSALVWAQQAGDLDFTYVPGESGTQITQTVLGGGADVGVAPLEPGLGDEFNLLMMTGERTLEMFPDVPNAADQGYDIPSGSATGYGTVAGVPDEHVQWIAELMRMVSETEEFKDAYSELDLTYLGPQEVQELRQAVKEDFAPILEEEGLTVRDDY